MWLVTEPSKALVLVEGRRLVVDGMDDDHRDPERFADGHDLSEGRDHQDAAQSSALKVRVKGEAPDQDGRHRIVATEMPVLVPTPGLSRREGEAFERKVPDHAAELRRFVGIYKNVGDRRALVLVARHRFVEIGVKIGLAATKATHIVPSRIEAFDDDCRRRIAPFG